MLSEVFNLTCSWDYLKNCKLPIILYGTGDGADKVLDECERLSISVSGVMASDGFIRQRTFRGFTVKSILDFETEYDDFVVILGFATQRDDVIKNITEIEKRHKILMPCVPVYGDEIINRNFLETNSAEIETAYGLLADEISKEVMLDFLRFEFSGELKYLFRSETAKDEAFNKILKLGEKESYLDLGAYRGDTIVEFLNYTNGKYKSITALEPDEKTFHKLTQSIDGRENITAIQKCIWSSNGFVNFDKSVSRGSAVNSQGTKSVESVTVDSLQNIDITTYLKADVEGCEAQMLYGGFDTLRRHKPKLNIAAYHTSYDFFRLALRIKEINPEYKIFLRHHKYIPCWDLNLYCI